MNRQQRRAAARSRGTARLRGLASTTTTPLESAKRLYGEGRFELAERRAREVLDLDPGDGAARIVLASCLREQSRFDEATMEARRGIAVLPKEPLAHEVLGRILLAQDRVVESAAAYGRAVELAPQRVEACQGLGAALLDGGVVDRARDQFSRVIELAPAQPGGYVNLSAAQLALGEFDAVGDTVAQAARAGAESSQLIWNGSMAALGRGDLEAGWAAYERGFEVGARTPARSFDVPRWTGGDVSDASVLVWREQGLGDEVRFVSCLRDLTRRAREVTAEVTPRLLPLFERSFPGVVFRADRSGEAGGRQRVAADGIDLHVPMGSLPRFFRPTIDSFPEEPGYLSADPKLRQRYRSRLADLPAGRKIGICWRSINLKTARLRAYATLDELAPLLSVPGATFVNLQYGPRDQLHAELAELERSAGVVIHAWEDLDYTDDLDGCAALTAELDLVIGPSSFPTLLAGSLGVPTFHFRTPFSWTHGGDLDPWFRNTQHFVRGWDEAWDGLIDQMRDGLAARTGAA